MELTNKQGEELKMALERIVEPTNVTSLKTLLGYVSTATNGLAYPITILSFYIILLIRFRDDLARGFFSASTLSFTFSLLLFAGDLITSKTLVISTVLFIMSAMTLLLKKLD